jgi:hypothetical protein
VSVSWHPSALRGLGLGQSGDPLLQTLGTPDAWALASFHGSGVRGQRPRGRTGRRGHRLSGRQGPPGGRAQVVRPGPAGRHGDGGSMAGPWWARRGLQAGRPCRGPPPSRPARAGGRGGACARRAWASAGAWRPRPAHLLGDPGLQLPADVAPGHAVQVGQLPEQQQGPTLRVGVPRTRLELQPHVRHLPPRPRPGHPRPAPARLGSAPPRPARPPRPASPAAAAAAAGRADVQGPPGKRGGAGEGKGGRPAPPQARSAGPGGIPGSPRVVLGPTARPGGHCPRSRASTLTRSCPPHPKTHTLLRA